MSVRAKVSRTETPEWNLWHVSVLFLQWESCWLHLSACFIICCHLCDHQSRQISSIYSVDNSGATDQSCLHSKQPKWSERASGIAYGLGADEHPGKWALSSATCLYSECQISQTPGWHGWVSELAHNKGDVPQLLPVSVASLNQEWRKVGNASQ